MREVGKNNKIPLTILLDKEDIEKIKKIIKNTGGAKSSFIRMCVKEKLKEYNNL